MADVKETGALKLAQPGQGKLPLSAADAALVTVFLIQEYAAAKGKPVTRFRIPKDALWRGLPAARLQKLVAEWKALLASDYGWLAFDTPRHFALIQAPLVNGWVMLGGKRFAETRQKLRDGDESVLAAMRAAVAPAEKAAA